MASKPKTFKLYVPGEVIKLIEEYTFQDGTKAILDHKESIVVPSKKNQQQIILRTYTDASGGKKTSSSIKASVQHEKWHLKHVKVFNAWANKIAAAGVSLPITRAKVKMLFYFPDSKRRDLGNKFETISDIMKDAGIIMDDEFKVFKPIHLDGWVNRAKPRTEIYLTVITGDMVEHVWDITPPEYEKERRERSNTRRRIRADQKRQAIATGL